MALFKTSMALVGGVIVYLAWTFLTLFVTWLLWCYSVGDMIPWTLPLSVERPDFVTYCSFWLLVALGLRSARDIWRGK